LDGRLADATNNISKRIALIPGDGIGVEVHNLFNMRRFLRKTQLVQHHAGRQDRRHRVRQAFPHDVRRLGGGLGTRQVGDWIRKRL
jgi:hypothetical protein